MTHVLIVYHSRTGTTQSMAHQISAALQEEGLKVVCKKVEEANVEEMLEADGVIVGSPTYYGTMAAEVKDFLDRSVAYHTRLDGKVGAAFASAGSTGQETTVLSIIQALLIHGMIVQGDCQGLHYGATSVGKPSESLDRSCRRFAKRYAALVKRVCASQ